MSNEEIFESSLAFLMKQIDIHVENQKRINKENSKNSNRNNDKKESKLMVLD